jgi:hypothetical protein
MNITVIDPSRMALRRIQNKSIVKMYGELPKINLQNKFDYIHLGNVLHHLIGNSSSRSKKMAIDSLFNIKKLLNNNGYFFVTENMYKSYCIPTLTREIIFYTLKLQIFFNIKISLKEFMKGLEVCFYTKEELIDMFLYCGFKIEEYNFESYKNNVLKKIQLLKDWGNIYYILKA